MADYISREAAIKEAFAERDSHSPYTSELCGMMAGAEKVAARLKHIPAADVRPVVRGTWIGYPECLKYPNAYADDHIVCSVCEECFSILDNCTERFDFCPHCGADMREES